MGDGRQQQQQWCLRVPEELDSASFNSPLKRFAFLGPALTAIRFVVY